MASTPATGAIGVELQAAGENLNTWGDPKLNNALQVLANIGVKWNAVTINGDTTVSETNYSTTNTTEVATIKLTAGTVNAAFNFVIPGRAKRFLLWNATGYTGTVKLAATTGVAIPNGRVVIISTDGSTDVYNLTPNYIGTSFTPALDGDLTNKTYVDAAISAAIVGTITGVLTVSQGIKLTGPGTRSAAVNTAYIDENVGDLRFLSYGPDAATNGTISFATARSDGSNVTTLLSISGTAVTATALVSTTNQATFSAGLVATGAGTASAANQVLIDQNGTSSGRIRGFGPDAATTGTLELGVIRSDGTSSTTVAALTAGAMAVTGTIAASSTVQGTQLISTVSTGTAPLTVASTTNVANLNASSLGGATFAAPGTIGGGTPAAATFTSVTTSALTSNTAQAVFNKGATFAGAGTAAVANNLLIDTNGGNQGRLRHFGQDTSTYGAILVSLGFSDASSPITIFSLTTASSKSQVSIGAIPVASAGLPSGTLWSDSGTIKIT